jgi:hypothetical protein
MNAMPDNMLPNAGLINNREDGGCHEKSKNSHCFAALGADSF